MPEDRATWRECEADARRAAFEYLRRPWDYDCDDYDAAHSFAEDHHDVIYHFHALDIYCDESEVRDYFEDAAEYVEPAERTPESIAGVCLYLALRDAFTDTVEQLRADATHSPSITANAQRMRDRMEYGSLVDIAPKLVAKWRAEAEAEARKDGAK